MPASRSHPHFKPNKASLGGGLERVGIGTKYPPRKLATPAVEALLPRVDPPPVGKRISKYSTTPLFTLTRRH
eukprot:1301951-Rhodomonas_salina.1